MENIDTKKLKQDGLVLDLNLGPFNPGIEVLSKTEEAEYSTGFCGDTVSYFCDSKGFSITKNLSNVNVFVIPTFEITCSEIVFSSGENIEESTVAYLMRSIEKDVINLILRLQTVVGGEIEPKNVVIPVANKPRFYRQKNIIYGHTELGVAVFHEPH